ncbi:Organic cation/carnitine transporter 7 [Diplonema papillatum]|nr:Organic cation/carnitine transporter 7 [Diplonema papillatum]KAJ9455773.1 Organic cation/carnitine transporter 7 [Diplonema papillatum]|eukprot:gene13411-20665_t
MSETSSDRHVSVAVNAASEEEQPVLPSHDGATEAELNVLLDKYTGRYQLMALVALGLANAADSAELMVISFILPELDFVSDTMKGILSASMFVGMLVGGLTAGSLADLLGRKPCLLVAMAINLVFGLAIVIFDKSWEWIFLCRVLAGVGVGGTVPVMFTMSAELTGLTYRGKFITIVCCFWMIGGIFTAGSAWLLLGWANAHWTWLCVASQVPNFSSMILLLCFVDETPRFHVMKKMPWLARVTLIKMAAAKKMQFTESFGLQDTNLERSRSVDDADITTTSRAPMVMDPPPDTTLAFDGGVARVPKMRAVLNQVTLLFAPKHKRTTLLLLVAWFALSFGWYGIILWIPKLFDDYGAGFDVYEDAFFVQLSNLPGNIASTLLVDRLGRKNLLVSSMALSCLVCIGMALQTNVYAVVAFACLYNGVSISGWNSLSCLSSESYPTKERSTAVGLLSACGRVASGLSQLAFGMMFHYGLPPSAILLTAATMMLAGTFAAYYLPFEPAGHDIRDSD